MHFNTKVAAIICAWTIFSASAALAGTDVLQPVQTVRLGAFKSDIGVKASQAVDKDNLVAWVAKEDSEYRMALKFDLGAITAPNILKAVLKFDAKAWLAGRDSLTVDVPTLTSENLADAMYAKSTSILLHKGYVEKQYKLDLTEAVGQAKRAGKSSIVIRFYQDNDSSGNTPAPYTAKADDYVVVDSGSTINSPELTIVSGDASAIPTPQVNASGSQYQIDASAADQGDIEKQGTLANTIAGIGRDSATIRLSASRSYQVNSELEIPANIELEFARGAFISIGAKGKLTINGAIKAGLQKIFDLKGKIDGNLQNTTVYPQWFGCVADGIADDTIPLQQAIDFASESKVLNIDLNRGSYRVTKTLNITNTRVPDTLSRDALTMRGGSLWGTRIIGDTGEGCAVIETSGSQCAEFSNFQLTAGSKNPSSIGLFVGCGEVLPQSQNQVYHLSIFMGDNQKANGGLGTIGIWNFASEEHTYQSMFIIANRPILMSAFNGMPNEGGPLPIEYKNSYVKLLKVHSLGVTTFSGESFLQAVGSGNAAITAQCANTITAWGVYINAINGKAFEIYGGLASLSYSGVIEGAPTFAELHGGLQNSNVAATFGLVNDPTAPLFTLDNNAQIYNSTIRFSLAEHRERPLFGFAKTAASQTKAKVDMAAEIKKGQANDIAPSVGLTNETIKNASIINSQIYVNLATKYLTIPESVKKNSKNVTIFGENDKIEF